MNSAEFKKTVLLSFMPSELKYIFLDLRYISICILIIIIIRPHIVGDRCPK